MVKRYTLTHAIWIFIVILNIYSIYRYITEIQEITFSFDNSLSAHAQKKIRNYFSLEQLSYTDIASILQIIKDTVPYCKSISARLRFPQYVEINYQGYNALCLCNNNEILLENGELVNKENIALSVVSLLPCIDFVNGVADYHSLKQLISYIQSKPLSFFDHYKHAWRDETYIVIQPKIFERVTVLCDINSIVKLQKICRHEIIEKVRDHAQYTITIDTRFKNQIVVTGTKGGGNGSC